MPPETLIDGRRFGGWNRFPCARHWRFCSFRWCNCWRVVVAGDADHAGARADRSQGEAALRLLRAVPRRADAARSDDAYFGRADRAGSGAAREDLRMRAHLFDRERPRPGAGDRRQGRAEGDAGHLARQRPAEERRADFDGDPPLQGISRRHHLARGRQRGAAARGDDDQRPRHPHPLGEGAGLRSRHLCRRLGILAALSRNLRGGRFHHHPHPALLGRLPDPRQIRGDPCQSDPPAHGGDVSRQGNPDRRDRLAEPGTDARGRAAVAHQPGPRGLGNPADGQDREFPGQPDRGL